MANLSDKTIRKMREVIALVLANAKFYDQYLFPRIEDCGSVCCAAGWVVWNEVGEKRYQQLVEKHDSDVWWAEEAKRILGLRNYLSTLFAGPSAWPLKFHDQYLDAMTDKQRARAMADRWEHFIKTDGME